MTPTFFFLLNNLILISRQNITVNERNLSFSAGILSSNYSKQSKYQKRIFGKLTKYHDKWMKYRRTLAGILSA